VLITVGHSKSKKIEISEGKHKTIAIFYTIAFLVIIGTIISGKLPVLGSL
jgi:archaellum biogenesis protein FlaJ (TadC family)